MNTDFPRIITLLRKERNISQKQAAADLGVSQALLSHYEKGIRECGLDFLVKTADYYNVSCDYLLGRCAEPMGKADIPAAVRTDAEKPKTEGILKQITDSVSLVLSMAKKSGDERLQRETEGYLSLAVYRIFRVLYSANPKNDKRFFTIDSLSADGFTLSAMELKKARAEAAAKSGSMQSTSITTNSISEDHPEYASSLFNSIKSCEESISGIMSSNDDIK